MNTTMKTALKFIFGGLGVLLIVAGAAAGNLIYIGAPSTASSLSFQGFIPLRSGSTLSVLDYLTLNDEQLFVTNESSGDVYKIALRPGTLPAAAEVSMLKGEPATHGVVFDPASHLGFVTRSEINTVDVFDPTKMVVIKRISVADDPDAIFFDPRTKLLYVASGDSNLATLIDPATQAPVATIPLGGKPEYAALDPSSGLLYQNLRSTNEVVAVDIAKRAVVQRWPLQGCEAPTGMALDEDHRRLFIGCNTSAVLAVFDLNEHRLIASVPIGKGPDTVAFDPGLNRIYIAGKSGILVVIEQQAPATYKVLDTLHLHYGAHTLVVDPSSHALYVAYASLITSPRIAVFDARR